MTAAQRAALAEVLEAIAYFHPRAATSLVRVMRLDTVPDETVEGIFGNEVVAQCDVVLALAWPLLGAAMGAESPDDRQTVLRELCLLTEAEAQVEPQLQRGLPNDGKRAAHLLSRVIQGGPQFWSEYDDTAAELGIELLDALSKKAPSRGQVALLKALVLPLLEKERRQSWDDGRSFTWRTFDIAPGSTAWAARETVLSQLKEILQKGNGPPASLVQLWTLFARAQEGDPTKRLAWTREVLTGRTTSLEELTAARDVWDWHRRFDKAPEVKAAAEALETLYASNDLAKEFQPLVPGLDNWKDLDARFAVKAAELASATDSDEIDAFIERAIVFLGDEQSLHRLDGLAWQIGSRAEKHEAVQNFVRASLQQAKITTRTEFAVLTAVSWLTALRASRPARTHEILRDLLASCANDDRRAHLLEQIYARVPRLRGSDDFTPEEHKILRSSRDLFMRTGREVQLVTALVSTADYSWDSLRPLLEGVLSDVKPTRRPAAASALVEGVYWLVQQQPPVQLPARIAEWLLTQLLTLPDFDDLGGNNDWHLSEVINRLGPVELEWLPRTLARREESESDEKSEGRVLSRNSRISQYVSKITANDVSSAAVISAVHSLLDFVKGNGAIAYYLPEVLQDIDPEGLIVPMAVATRVAEAPDAEMVYRLARIGGAYSVNSPAWRTIALAVTHASGRLGTDGPASVYAALGDRGVRIWSGIIGEVPSMFLEAVSSARTNLDAEQEASLRPYWQQRLARAEADLLEQVERAKEDRGE